MQDRQRDKERHKWEQTHRSKEWQGIKILLPKPGKYKRYSQIFWNVRPHPAIFNCHKTNTGTRTVPLIWSDFGCDYEWPLREYKAEKSSFQLSNSTQEFLKSLYKTTTIWSKLALLNIQGPQSWCEPFHLINHCGQTCASKWQKTSQRSQLLRSESFFSGVSQFRVSLFASSIQLSTFQRSSLPGINL